jgi:hypothetical protein
MKGHRKDMPMTRLLPADGRAPRLGDGSPLPVEGVAFNAADPAHRRLIAEGEAVVQDRSAVAKPKPATAKIETE